MNRRGTEPYARWCGRTAGVTPPPTRSAKKQKRPTALIPSTFYPPRALSSETRPRRVSCAPFRHKRPGHRQAADFEKPRAYSARGFFVVAKKQKPLTALIPSTLYPPRAFSSETRPRRVSCAPFGHKRPGHRQVADSEKPRAQSTRGFFVVEPG